MFVQLFYAGFSYMIQCFTFHIGIKQLMRLWQLCICLDVGTRKHQTASESEIYSFAMLNLIYCQSLMWHHLKGSHLYNTNQLDTIIVQWDSRVGSRIAQWHSAYPQIFKLLLLHFALKMSSSLSYLLLLL